jgi:hypothetical protein
MVFPLNGSTKLSGIGAGDVSLAFAPLVIGWPLARAARFVVTGSALKRSRAVPYRRP